MSSDLKVSVRTPHESAGAPQAGAAARAAGDASPAGADARLPHASIVLPKKVELTLDPHQKESALRQALAEVNRQMADSKQHLGFAVDPALPGPIIRVHNTQTGEVVRTIPSEEVIRVAHSIDSLKGVLFNKKT